MNLQNNINKSFHLFVILNTFLFIFSSLNSNLGQYGTGIINLFSQNPYTAPSDGFVIAFANPKTTNTEGIFVTGTLTPFQCKCVNGNACMSTTLVKKGSRIQIDATSGLEPTSVCLYVPLHN